MYDLLYPNWFLTPFNQPSLSMCPSVATLLKKSRPPPIYNTLIQEHFLLTFLFLLSQLPQSLPDVKIKKCCVIMRV